MKTWIIKIVWLGLLLTMHTAWATQQSVVLISLDGFRWDYIEKYQAQNLQKIAQHGVKANKLIPVYPTKTFPNHISIITGLLPVNHGIVDNKFCDKSRMNQCYAMGKGLQDSSWLNGIPLWNLAKMHGLKSATYFWPESDARFNGMTPDYYYHYSKYSDYQQRVDQIIAWLSLPDDQRPNFVASYFSLVDTMGHDFGPNSEQTRDAVIQLDTLMGQLYSRLQQLNKNINLVIVSDHGMSEVDPQQSIFINSLPQNDNFKLLNSGSRVLIYSKPNSAANISAYKAQLIKAAKGRYSVLTAEQLTEYNYNKGPRVSDIILQTTAPRVFTNAGKADYLGTHGYAYNDDMAAIFIAAGPAFKSGFNLDKVNNLDIYPVLAKVLGLQPLNKLDSDGSTLLPALKNKDTP